MKTRTFQTAWAVALTTALSTTAYGQSVISGANLDLAPTELTVPIVTGDGGDHWEVELALTHDPLGPPMLKSFIPPTDSIFPGTGWPVWEIYDLDNDSQPVSDWHEEILGDSPGWIWQLLPGESLITKNGDPHPFLGGIDPNDATRLWVAFEPISPPDVLDVHKELFYEGADLNGDGTVDFWPPGRPVLVLEYPTPEPGSMAITLVGLIGLTSIRRKFA
jgi:hypothetical protein